jgi:site-specific recombinase XerD
MNHTPIRCLKKLLEDLEGAYAPNTLRAYEADMLEFIRWCGAERKRSLPAAPQSVADFLLQCTDHPIKASTIRRKAFSISAIHRLSNLPDPTKDSAVRIAIRKICRILGTRFAQAYPINRPLLNTLLKACSKDLRGKRNQALLRLAYDSLRRRSELVSLRVDDLEWIGRGAAILLRRSKTDQLGAGIWVHVGQDTAQALRIWIKASGIKTGFLLRAIDSQNRITESLSGHQLCKIFKRLAVQSGLDPTIARTISGHSMRVGAAQDLMLGGATMPQIMSKGGWSKTDTVLRYVQRVRPDVMTGRARH